MKTKDSPHVPDVKAKAESSSQAGVLPTGQTLEDVLALFAEFDPAFTVEGHGNQEQQDRASAPEGQSDQEK